MTADTRARPTQPYTHRNSGPTDPALAPPMMPWATIHAQARRPRTRRPTRIGRGGRCDGASVAGGVARTSRASTNRNDSATVTAAPAR